MVWVVVVLVVRSFVAVTEFAVGAMDGMSLVVLGSTGVVDGHVDGLGRRRIRLLLLHPGPRVVVQLLRFHVRLLSIIRFSNYRALTFFFYRGYFVTDFKAAVFHSID